MAQFTVYHNRNAASPAPYLLNVQSDLLSELRTRVVAPLYPVDALGGKAVSTLMPVFELNGEPLLMLTAQLAGVDKQELGDPVSDFSIHRSEIVAALDLLLTGF